MDPEGPAPDLDDATVAAAVLGEFDPRTLPRWFYDNPYPLYRLLRERDPVHRTPDGSWFITRYADALAVYRDHERLSSDKQVEFAPKFGNGPLFGHHTTSLVFRDPPYHTVVRKLIQHFFTPAALAAMEGRVTALVDRMLDRFEDAGTMDLVGDYAFALPAEVVCDLLGVPRGDRGQLRNWAQAILGALEPQISAEQLASGDAAVVEFSTYLRGLVAEKRRLGASDEVDILSGLVHAVDDTGSIDEYELIQNCIFMLNAGHETTTSFIANGVNTLLENRAALESLRADPSLMDRAVDELLRCESPNQLGNRRVVAEVEVGGVRMAPGDLITICIGAANRDPVQFADPDRLDVARHPNRHLAFIAGIHRCAGAPLARLEGRVAIGRLIRRFPDLRRDGRVERDRRARFRVVQSFPVAAQ